MYAIIQTGGKQYRVSAGDVIDIELLHAKPGAQVEFTEVLFVHDGKTGSLGLPVVKDFVVKAECLGQALGPKVVAYKYRRRKDSSTKKGHRQKYSRIKITEIAPRG